MLQPLEQPPALIAEAGPTIRAAVAEAARFALDNRDGLAVVDVAAGAGKTREALAVAAQLAADGARVVFALPTVDGAAEKAGELAQLIAEGVAVPVPVELAAGALRDGPDGCRVWGEALPPTRARFERIFARDGRAVCNGCPFRQGCKAAEPPKAAPGVVTLAAHAGAAFLARGAHDGPPDPAPLVVFYDESPDLVTGAEVTRAHLATLAAAPAGADWRKRNRGAALAAEALIKALDTMASEEAEAARRRPVEYDPIRPLAALLEARPGGVPYLDPDGEGWGAGARAADEPPRPDPATARRDGGAGWPDREAWRAVQALLARDPLARVVFKAEGWTVERRRAWTPPEGAAVVVLDATPNRIALEAVARNAGRTVRAWTVPVVGVGPRLALHLDSERFANGRIRRRDGVLLAAARYAFGMINRALPAGWASRAAEGRPVVVGVLTHKALAVALRGQGRGEEAEAAADLATEATNAGMRFEFGHFGADGVASNRFARVDVLAVVGDPRTHKEAARFDALALGLDDAGALAYLAAKDAGAAVQALARARWSRPDREGGPPALIWCGRTPPTVPGGWTVVQPSQGSRTLAAEARPGALQLDTLARDLAERCSAIAPAALIIAAGARGVDLGRKPAERLAEAEGRRRGWHAFRVATGGRGRPVTVYAANAPRAEALATWTRAEAGATWTKAAGAVWGGPGEPSRSRTVEPAVSKPSPAPRAPAPQHPETLGDLAQRRGDRAPPKAPARVVEPSKPSKRAEEAAHLAAVAEAAEALVTRYRDDERRPLEVSDKQARRLVELAREHLERETATAEEVAEYTREIWLAWVFLRESPTFARTPQLRACREIGYLLRDAVRVERVAAAAREAGFAPDDDADDGPPGVFQALQLEPPETPPPPLGEWARGLAVDTEADAEARRVVGARLVAEAARTLDNPHSGAEARALALAELADAARGADLAPEEAERARAIMARHAPKAAPGGWGWRPDDTEHTARAPASKPAPSKLAPVVELAPHARTVAPVADLDGPAEALVSRYLEDKARPLDLRPDPAVRAATVAAVRVALAEGHAPADLWAAWTWLRDSPAFAKGPRRGCRTLAYAVNRRNVATLIAEARALQDKAQ